MAPFAWARPRGDAGPAQSPLPPWPGDVLSPEQIDAFLRLGAAGLLAVAVLALVLEIVVSGRAYRRVLAERDEAYTRVDRFIDILESATGIKAQK